MPATTLKNIALLPRIAYLGTITLGFVMLTASTLLLLVVALADPLSSADSNDTADTRISVEIPQIPAPDTLKQGTLTLPPTTAAST